MLWRSWCTDSSPRCISSQLVSAAGPRRPPFSTLRHSFGLLYSLRGPAGQLSMTLRLCLPALRNRQYRQQEATESPPNPQSITEALSLANRLFLGYSLAGCPPGRARLRFSDWNRFLTGVQWFLSDQQQPP